MMKITHSHADYLGISHVRVTQIMDLTLLAPDIQEVILCSNDNNQITEGVFRIVFKTPVWEEQVKIWGNLPETII